MGRTIPSFQAVIEQEISRVMHTYGAGLSKRDRHLLKDTLDLCDRHSQACSRAMKLVPMRSILMAVIFEHEKILQELAESI